MGRGHLPCPPSSILTPLFSKHNVHLRPAVNVDSVAVQVQRHMRGQLSNIFCYVRGGRNVTGVRNEREEKSGGSNKVTCAFLFSLCASWCWRVRIGVGMFGGSSVESFRKRFKSGAEIEVCLLSEKPHKPECEYIALS